MLELSEQNQSEIRVHGERDYPHECCGLLLGRFTENGLKVCLEIYPISNAHEEEAKRNRFLIRPDELLRGEQHAAANSLEIVGFYHSHPDHTAIPSAYDLEHAWPVYSYIVAAVKNGKAEDLRSWEMQLDRSKFEEEEIRDLNQGERVSTTCVSG